MMIRSEPNHESVVMMDLSSLTELRAFSVIAETDAVAVLGKELNQVRWLLLDGSVEVEGDLSLVTHLHLSRSCQMGPKYAIMKRCQALRQLSLFYLSFELANAIPASVDRLFIEMCEVRGMQLLSEKMFEVLSLFNVNFLYGPVSQAPQTLKATHLRLGADYCDYLPSIRHLLRETVLASPRSLVVSGVVAGADGRRITDFLETVLEKEEFRRHIEFFATNMPLKNPLPPMPKLRELCLQSFSDVNYLREIGKPMPIETLFIAENNGPFLDDGGTLRLQDITESLLVPAGLRLCACQRKLLQVTKSCCDHLCPGDLPIRITPIVPPSLNTYAGFLWADHVHQSSGEFDIDYSFLNY